MPKKTDVLSKARRMSAVERAWVETAILRAAPAEGGPPDLSGLLCFGQQWRGRETAPKRVRATGFRV
jgi:hypothetical protein